VVSRPRRVRARPDTARARQPPHRRFGYEGESRPRRRFALAEPPLLMNHRCRHDRAGQRVCGPRRQPDLLLLRLHL